MGKGKESSHKQTTTSDKPSPNIQLVVGVIAALALIIVALINRTTPFITIHATQTAEALHTSIAMTSQAVISQTPETPAPSETPSLTPNETVFFDRNIYHLGDTIHAGEPDWSPLQGECKDFNFVVQLPILATSLTLETYGVEEGYSIKINNTENSTIHQANPSAEIWADGESIILPTSAFLNGANMLTVCSIIGPDGDKDDFQIRNIRVEIKR